MFFLIFRTVAYGGSQQIQDVDLILFNVNPTLRQRIVSTGVAYLHVFINFL